MSPTYSSWLVDGPDKGIIPLTCSELFDRVGKQEAEDPNLKITVEVSYIEVSGLGASTQTCLDPPAPDLQ